LNLDKSLQQEGCWTYINREVIALCSGVWSGLFQGALDGCNGARHKQDEPRATASPAKSFGQSKRLDSFPVVLPSKDKNFGLLKFQPEARQKVPGLAFLFERGLTCGLCSKSQRNSGLERRTIAGAWAVMATFGLSFKKERLNSGSNGHLSNNTSQNTATTTPGHNHSSFATVLSKRYACIKATHSTASN
jgi:hypothetical protein